MAIQMRRGLRVDFDPAKMLPGEWAVAIDSDTANQIIWMCFAPGVVKQIGAYEDYERLIEEHYSEYIPDVLCTVEDGDNASRSYSTGDLFIFKGKMYAATANIASGDSLASASKKETTIEEELEGKQATLTFDTTPTENSNNPITSGGVKNALDAKQDSLTFDDSPSEGSQNPVKSGGIFTALNGKVDKITGKGLSTEDYTTEEKSKLSGIETGAQVNKVETVNSIQPDSNKNVALTAENIPAEGIGDKTVSGNPITVTDALESIAKDLQVEFGPIQDLHGYDHPWVGGAGKNLLKTTGTNQTRSGVTYTVNSDGTVLVNGTSTQLDPYTVGTVDLVGGTVYVLSSGVTNDSTFYLQAIGDGISNINTISGAKTFTPSADTTATIRIAISSGKAVSNVTVKPMICLSTATDPTVFAPYSNICPISGRTEIAVTRSDGAETDPDIDTASVSFGQTVYGGQVDFVTGKVRVTLANIASYNGETIGEPWWSSMDEYVSGATPTIGAQVVYTLATPIELTLTPAQLSLLEGLNILTTDGDNIVLTYLGSEASNVQDEIDEFENGLNNVIGSIAFIENSTAKTSHAIGEYVILNGIFCKVISAVSSGETLSFGTNIQATTIGAELRAIWAQIQS